MQIRKINKDDCDTIYKFIVDLEQTSFDRKTFDSIFNKNINAPDNIYLIALNPEPVGFLTCHIQGLLHHCGLIGEIQEMYVTKESRNLGIGKLLLDKVKEIASERQVLQLEVVSNVKRIDAHRFYETQGFTHTSKKFVWKLAGK